MVVSLVSPGEENVALNIKNAEVERLATEVAEATGETKTQAIRVALDERRRRLAFQERADDRRARLLRFLEREAWPLVPLQVRERALSPEDEAEILGFGPDGV